jgi:hypothetical protein
MNRVNSSYIYNGVDATRREASNEVSLVLLRYLSRRYYLERRREKKATMKATPSLMNIFKGIIKNGSAVRAQRVIRL